MELILLELQEYSQKRRHWAWWVFPTTKTGISEPYPESCVTRVTAPFLVLTEMATLWREILEIIIALVAKERLDKILPPVDHDRVYYFCELWGELPSTPLWLLSCIKKLVLAILQCKCRGKFCGGEQKLR